MLYLYRKTEKLIYVLSVHIYELGVHMRQLTEKEKEIVLLLTKDFTTYYNAHSISKQVRMSHKGASKALKFLEQNEIVKSQKIGRAIIYKLTFNEYARELAALFLFEEARAKAPRWVKEFEQFKKADALILFGSVLCTNKYKDIDLLVLIDEKNYSTVDKQVLEKNAILVKPIHPVWQVRADLEKNLRKKDPVMLEIIKTGLVLKGQHIIMEVLADVTRFE